MQVKLKSPLNIESRSPITLGSEDTALHNAVKLGQLVLSYAYVTKFL